MCHADDDGTGYLGHHKIALSATGIPLYAGGDLFTGGAVHRQARTESLPKSRPIAIAIVSLLQKNGYGETVESCEKKRQVGPLILWIKMLWHSKV